MRNMMRMAGLAAAGAISVAGCASHLDRFATRWNGFSGGSISRHDLRQLDEERAGWRRDDRSF